MIILNVITLSLEQRFSIGSSGFERSDLNVKVKQNKFLDESKVKKIILLMLSH